MSSQKKNTINTLQQLFSQIHKTKFISESTLTSRVLFCFIFISIFAKLFFSHINLNDGTNGPATINIMSYFVIMISLISLVFLNTITQLYKKEGDLQMSNTISVDLVIVVIYFLWLISINMKYYNNINLKKVPPGFFLYSNLTHGVIGFQLLIYMANFIMTNDREFSLTRGVSDLRARVSFINYLLIFLNFILILIQQIILENFTVDIV